MAYVPTGRDVALYVTVDKRQGGAAVSGYPKEYLVTNAFGSYAAITVDAWQKMAQSNRTVRLNAFIAYVNGIEGISISETQTNQPYRDTPGGEKRTITYSIPEATPNVVTRQFEVGAAAVIESPSQLGMVLPSGDTFDGWSANGTAYTVGQVVTMNTNLVLNGATSETPSGDSVAGIAVGTNMRGKTIRATNINKPFGWANSSGSGYLRCGALYLYHTWTYSSESRLIAVRSESAPTVNIVAFYNSNFAGWQDTLEYTFPDDQDYIVTENTINAPISSSDKWSFADMIILA